MVLASMATVAFIYSQMQKSDQDDILSLALRIFPADLLVDTGLCIFKKKMPAAGSVAFSDGDDQPEVSRRFANAAPHPLQTSLVWMNWAGPSTALQGQQLRIKKPACKHTKHFVHNTNPLKKAIY